MAAGGETTIAAVPALAVAADATITFPGAEPVGVERIRRLPEIAAGDRLPRAPETLGLPSIAPGRTGASQRLFDIALTIILLPIITLVGAAIALAIYIDSPGPVIYRSWRIGRGGRPFVMLKFRKMRADAGHRPLTVADDERFTPIGRFLAATRLDELPQVWNVLRGEMRLVGPRPEVEYFVAQFTEEYGEILTVTPGITGRSQLRFLDEQSLLAGPDPHSTYRDQVLPAKLDIDLAYVRGHSLRGDLAILARTVALPFTLLAARLHSRRGAVGTWLPTAVTAMLLVLLFVVTSSRIA